MNIVHAFRVARFFAHAWACAASEAEIAAIAGSGDGFDQAARVHRWFQSEAAPRNLGPLGPGVGGPDIVGTDVVGVTCGSAGQFRVVSSPAGIEARYDSPRGSARGLWEAPFEEDDGFFIDWSRPIDAGRAVKLLAVAAGVDVYDVPYGTQLPDTVMSCPSFRQALEAKDGGDLGVAYDGDLPFWSGWRRFSGADEGAAWIWPDNDLGWAVYVYGDLRVVAYRHAEPVWQTSAETAEAARAIALAWADALERGAK